MTKSRWKLPYISNSYFQNRFLNKISLNVRSRNSIIPSIFIHEHIKLCIFNGIWYLSKTMSSNMLGCKLGEFSFTKRSDTQTHLKRKTKKKTKGKK